MGVRSHRRVWPRGSQEPRERARGLMMSANSKRPFSAAPRRSSRSEMLSRGEADDGRCDQPSGQAASCERSESRSPPSCPSCWGERRRAGEGCARDGGALERRCTRGAFERGGGREACGALARWRARKAVARGAAVPRARDAECPDKFPERAPVSYKKLASKASSKGLIK